MGYTSSLKSQRAALLGLGLRVKKTLALSRRCLKRKLLKITVSSNENVDFRGTVAFLKCVESLRKPVKVHRRTDLCARLREKSGISSLFVSAHEFTSENKESRQDPWVAPIAVQHRILVGIVVKSLIIAGRRVR